METYSLKENELITGISILAVLRHTQQLELSKCILIEPLLSYSQVLRALKRSNSSIKSMEDLILKQSIPFANFNNRFQEKLLLSMNSLILFEKLDLISIEKVLCTLTHMTSTLQILRWVRPQQIVFLLPAN